MKVLMKKDATYEPIRVTGKASQACCEWIGPSKDWAFESGIAELRKIRIENTWAVTEYMTVIEGHIRLIKDGVVSDLYPGDSVFMSKGDVVTVEVPDRMLWAYTADVSKARWQETLANEAPFSEL